MKRHFAVRERREIKNDLDSQYRMLSRLEDAVELALSTLGRIKNGDADEAPRWESSYKHSISEIIRIVDTHIKKFSPEDSVNENAKAKLIWVCEDDDDEDDTRVIYAVDLYDKETGEFIGRLDDDTFEDMDEAIEFAEEYAKNHEDEITVVYEEVIDDESGDLIGDSVEVWSSSAVG